MRSPVYNFNWRVNDAVRRLRHYEPRQAVVADHGNVVVKEAERELWRLPDAHPVREVYGREFRALMRSMR